MSNYLDEWQKLAPVYFPKWVWSELVAKDFNKYGGKYPTYQNQKVILT